MAMNDPFATPEGLVQAFSALNDVVFLDLSALTNRVRELSDAHGCRYIARSTGQSREVQIYSCRYHRSIFNCPACVRFRYSSDEKKAAFISCDSRHSHAVGEMIAMRMKNHLTSTQREKIRAATEQGFSAYQIRMQNCLTCSKDVLYSARREALAQAKSQEMEKLLQEMRTWKNWENIIRVGEDRKFDGCYLFHIPVCHACYSKDICILDDTSCTNHFGLPLLVMASEDENARTQVMAYAILTSRTKSEFVDFFQEVRLRVGDIRLFVSDRNKTQISALQDVFPDCLIIYCSVHIGRNIKQKCSKELKSLYFKMRHLEIEESEFIKTCEENILANPGSKATKFLQNLLRETEHWLPSHTMLYIHCDNETTNRIEGFFGSLKNLLEHKLHTLANLVRAVYIRSERLLIQSRTEKRIAVPEDLMAFEDQDRCGVYCLSLLGCEFSDLRETGARDVTSEDCCKNHLMFNIPCKHFLLRRLREDASPLLTLADIPKRWQRSEYPPSTPNHIETRSQPTKTTDSSWDYGTCVDKFERYFSAAHRSPAVRQVLTDTLERLNSLEHQSGDEDGSTAILPPDNLLIAGASPTHPRRAVEMPGARRKRKKYRCSLCGATDHTAPRCPKSTLNA